MCASSPHHGRHHGEPRQGHAKEPFLVERQSGEIAGGEPADRTVADPAGYLVVHADSRRRLLLPAGMGPRTTHPAGRALQATGRALSRRRLISATSAARSSRSRWYSSSHSIRSRLPSWRGGRRRGPSTPGPVTRPHECSWPAADSLRAELAASQLGPGRQSPRRRPGMPRPMSEGTRFAVRSPGRERLITVPRASSAAAGRTAVEDNRAR